MMLVFNDLDRKVNDLLKDKNRPYITDFVKYCEQCKPDDLNAARQALRTSLSNFMNSEWIERYANHTHFVTYAAYNRTVMKMYIKKLVS